MAAKTELLSERTTASPDSFDTGLCRLNTVIELLRHRALNQPDQLAYTFLADRETMHSREIWHADVMCHRTPQRLKPLQCDAGGFLVAP